MLLNLAGVCNTEDKSVLWGFITRYAPEAKPENDHLLDEMVGRAINYYRDFVKPQKKYRTPTSEEIKALGDLLTAFESLPADAPAEDIQNEVYAVSKSTLTRTCESGLKRSTKFYWVRNKAPGWDRFVALYGLDETNELLRRAINGENLAA